MIHTGLLSVVYTTTTLVQGCLPPRHVKRVDWDINACHYGFIAYQLSSVSSQKGEVRLAPYPAVPSGLLRQEETGGEAPLTPVEAP